MGKLLLAPRKKVIRRRKKRRLEGGTQTAPIGVRDSLDPSDPNPLLAFEMQNVYPRDPFTSDGVRHRPGTILMGAQIASGQCQRGYQYTQLDGTTFTLQVCKGEIYTFNWSTSVWTKVVSSANLSSASVTLSTTAICYAATFANEVIISDGVNKPFSWDGASGAGGLTPLTNAQVIFGQPVVYSAKWFGILNTARSSFIWSEEASLNTGFEAGGFANVWTLGQTDQEALFTLMPTNEALYYTRARSTGAIWGAANDAFRTTTTHEAVSSNIGGKAPRGWVIVGNTIFLVDADARFQRLTIGGGYDEPGIWRDARKAIRLIDQSKIGEAEVVWNEDTDLVQFGVVLTGDTDKEKVFNFQATTGQYVGHAVGFTFDLLDMVKDGDGEPTMMHADSSGYAWRHAREGSSTYDDDDNTGFATAVVHILETSALFYATRDVKHFIRLDLILLSIPISSFTLFTRTSPTGLEASGTTVPISTSLWDFALWDVDTWSDFESEELRVVVGLNEYGRWLGLRFEHTALSEGFGYGGVEVEAYSDGADVETP